MEFLGNLGIDINLLIAQIVNFGLLLWLLTKFLYKPIIQRIEKDENELKQAQIQRKELEKKEQSFTEKKEKEMATLKKRTEKIISEAEYIAEKIRDDAHKKSNADSIAIITQSKNKLNSLRPDIERELYIKMQKKIKDSFNETFRNSLPVNRLKEIQDTFWVDLLEKFNRIPRKQLVSHKINESLMHATTIAKKNKIKKSLLEKELNEIFENTNGEILLEFVHPVNVKQEKQLKELIYKKIGIHLKIRKTKHEELIDGFRLEIAGFLIESNMLNIINESISFQNKQV